MYWSRCLFCFALLSWLATGRLLARSVQAETPNESEHVDQFKASAPGADGGLVLAQDTLNGTPAYVQCANHPTWFRSWTDHMHVRYYKTACWNAFVNMRDADVSPGGKEQFEFLAEGVPPGSKYEPMQTPRRYIGTGEGKSCTITIAMLRDIPPREIPRQPLTPRTAREVVSYVLISQAVSDIFTHCIHKGEDTAEFGWAKPGVYCVSPKCTPLMANGVDHLSFRAGKALRGLLVLVMGSGSQVDHDIPPGVFPSAGSTETRE
ncbi:MAG: hypothetical protein Q9181_000189 [Wetmoreana brouardii]